jgi:hypothetical protein
VVLTLAAAPGRSLRRELSGYRTGGSDHPRTCAPPVPACTGQTRCAADQDDVDTVSTPVMVRN